MSHGLNFKKNKFLKNLNILNDHQNDSESNWTNPVYHGVADKPTYEDKTVVVASKVLDAFKDYMNAKAFTNSYDHAIGFFK